VNPIEQHLATRRKAGLFDFSFMSLVEIDGPGAYAFVDRLQTRSVASLEPGRIVYTLLLNDDATVFVDATLWRFDDRWWIFTGRRSDVDAIVAQAADFEVDVRDRSGELVVLALQGPASGSILAHMAGETLARNLRYFRFADARVSGVDCIVGRLGYSGELGYELLAPAEHAQRLRDALIDRGVAVCGFDAANSLRIESGYVLFDREITGRESPLDLGLERLVDRAGRGFCGRAAFDSLHRAPLEWRLVGLAIADRATSSQLPVARVTSECDSPNLERRIALGFAPASLGAGDRVRLIDGRLATIARLPLYDPGRRLPRGDPL
jgi:glycine cleavage system T protein (aminomethyltransferase)